MNKKGFSKFLIYNQRIKVAICAWYYTNIIKRKLDKKECLIFKCLIDKLKVYE